MSITINTLSLETQAAIRVSTEAVAELVLARDDLIILTAHMAERGYVSNEIAYAVEKPWKFADVLADAKADLTGRA